MNDMGLDLDFGDATPATGTALATIDDAATALVPEMQKTALSAPEKAAVVLVALGPDTAAALLKELGSKRIRRFARVLNELPRIDNEEVDQILAEFLERLSDDQSVSGGKEETRRFLSSVLEKDQVAQIMTDLESARRSVWSALSDVDDARIAAWLEGEHPQVAAIALSRLTSVKAAQVIEKFDPDVAQSIVLRLAQAPAASHEVAARIGEVVEREFLPKARKSQEIQDPSDMIGAMMNHVSPKTRERLLAHMSEARPALADSVQKVMFTFENIIERVSPRDVGAISKAIDEAVLLRAFKGHGEIGAETAEFFFSNMSKRLAERMREDLEALETPKQKDSDAARALVVATITEMRDRGDIAMIETDEGEE